MSGDPWRLSVVCLSGYSAFSAALPETVPSICILAIIAVGVIFAVRPPK